MKPKNKEEMKRCQLKDTWIIPLDMAASHSPQSNVFQSFTLVTHYKKKHILVLWQKHMPTLLFCFFYNALNCGSLGAWNYNDWKSKYCSLCWSYKRKTRRFTTGPLWKKKWIILKLSALCNSVAKVLMTKVIVRVVCWWCQNWTLPISFDIIVAHVCNSAKGQPSQMTWRQYLNTVSILTLIAMATQYANYIFFWAWSKATK